MKKEFLENMKRILVNDYDNYLQSLNNEKTRAIQVNTSKISCDEFEKICPFDIKKIPWVENGYYVDSIEKIAKTVLYHCGLFYIQEATAMAPVSILNPKDNEKILDLCAAPGGKTLQIAIKNQNGVVVSNDISVSRLKAVIRNVEQYGLKNVIIVSNDIKKMKDKHLNYYDKVLLDAPCSGEGMFRKDLDVEKYWNENSNEKFSKIQEELSYDVIETLKNNGILVYSTCTFSPIENENIIKKLKDNKNMQISKIENYENVDFSELSEGICENIEKICYNLDDLELKKCKRLYPFKLKGEGHFVAKLIKGEIDQREIKKSEVFINYNDCQKQNVKIIDVNSNYYYQSEFKKNIQDLEKKVIFNEKIIDKVEIYQNGHYFYEKFNKAPKEFEIFCKEILNDDVLYKEGKINGLFKMNNEKLILEPNFIPDLKGLRVLRRGWYLGDISKGIFKPSQHFCMGLKFEWIKNKIIYDINDTELIKYLKCETLQKDVKNGWYVIIAYKYPLGFVKAVNGILKNKYPSSWRML